MMRPPPEPQQQPNVSDENKRLFVRNSRVEKIVHSPALFGLLNVTKKVHFWALISGSAPLEDLRSSHTHNYFDHTVVLIIAMTLEHSHMKYVSIEHSITWVSWQVTTCDSQENDTECCMQVKIWEVPVIWASTFRYLPKKRENHFVLYHTLASLPF